MTKLLCLDRLVPPCGAHEIELDIESELWQVDECVIDCWPLLECAFCVFHWAVLISTAWRHPHEVATLLATDVCIAFVQGLSFCLDGIRIQKKHKCRTWVGFPCDLCSTPLVNHEASCNFCKDCIEHMQEVQTITIG